MKDQVDDAPGVVALAGSGGGGIGHSYTSRLSPRWPVVAAGQRIKHRPVVIAGLNLRHGVLRPRLSWEQAERRATPRVPSPRGQGRPRGWRESGGAMSRSSPILGNDKLARSRERFLTRDPVEPQQVREPILASWWRSRQWNVPADKIELAYVRDPNLDTPLTRSAMPVLRHLREHLE